MAIQIRRGNEADFQAGRMLPAEMAASLDANIVRICFGSGTVKELALKEFVETGLSSLSDDIEAEISQLEQDLATAGTSLSSLTGRVGAAENSLTDHGTRITALEGKEAEDRTRIGALESVQEAQATTLLGLTTRMGTVESTASGATALATNNERRIALLEPAMASANQDIANLGRGVQANTQEITALKARVTSAEGDIEDILEKDVVWSFAVNSAGHLIETVERYDLDNVVFELQEGRMMVIYG